jgi:hypothetical protein
METQASSRHIRGRGFKDTLYSDVYRYFLGWDLRYPAHPSDGACLGSSVCILMSMDIFLDGIYAILPTHQMGLIWTVLFIPLLYKELFIFLLYNNTVLFARLH